MTNTPITDSADVYDSAPSGTGYPTDGTDMAGSHGIRTLHAAVAAAACFFSALALKPVALDVLVLEQRKRVLSLMQQTVLAVEWYDGEIEKGKKTYWRFLLGALALIVLVPVAATIARVFAASTESSPWIEILVSFAAAILGAQALLREGFSHRFRFAAFWEARSKIKTEYAKLITKWQGRKDLLLPGQEAGKFTFSDEFTTDLKVVREAALAAIEAEQRSFFDQLQLPAIDMSVFGTARAAVAKMLADATPSAAATAQTAADAVERTAQERAALSAVVQRLDAAIQDVERQQKALTDQIAAARDAEKAALTAALKPRLDNLAAISTDLYTERKNKVLALAKA